MKTRVLSELFILSLCVLVSFSAKSRPKNPANSGGQGDSNVQQRQLPQFQPPVQPSSAARRAEPESRISDSWPSSGDDDDDVDHDVDQQQSGDDDDPIDGYKDDDDEGGDENYDDGDGNIDEDEDDPGSGTDEVPEDVPQVTRGPLRTRCQNMSSARAPYPEAYRPQCTDDGAFMPMQCHRGTGECWCVDVDGNVYGKVYRDPHRPTCSPDRAPWTPAPIERSTPADDIDIFDGSPSVQTPDVRRPIGDEDRENPGVEPVPARTWYEYILHHPLLLTAVIAGSVLFLVIVVLMLMFCVYRMRKKDEGSYSLDEPRQTFNYTRAKDQEFFA